jgi:hypothetical protein
MQNLAVATTKTTVKCMGLESRTKKSALLADNMRRERRAREAKDNQDTETGTKMKTVLKDTLRNVWSV